MGGILRRVAAGALVVAFVSFVAYSLYAYFEFRPQESAARIDPRDETQVARGGAVYTNRCAQCHGTNLEGQPNWRVRRSDGRLPAPPQDASGHTWHHPNEVLFGIVKYGLAPPYAPRGYESDMPAFGSSLSDADIRAVLAYIESRWPPEVMKMRREMLGGRPG